MTVAIEGIYPLRTDASFELPVASRKSARTERAAAKKLIDQDIPARLSPDRAVFVKPVLTSLFVMAGIGGTISLWAFIETVQHFVITGINGVVLGAGLWTIIELAMLTVTLLIAMLNARGEHIAVVVFGWLFVVGNALLTVFINFTHALVLIRPGQDVSELVKDINPALQPILTSLLGISQWVVVGALSIVPLIVLAIFAFIEVALVRRAKGTRKQRANAAAKREAAAVVADEQTAVAVAAPVVARAATPRNVAAAPAGADNFRPEVHQFLVEKYREFKEADVKATDTLMKRELANTFGFKRSIFDHHAEGAKREAGVA